MTLLLLAAVGGTARAVDYRYDRAGRLVEAAYDDGTRVRYSYDASGNLVRRRVTGSGRCVAGPRTLCLNGDRFEVKGSWRTAFDAGMAEMVEVTDDTGYLTFFDPANVEVVVKVLDACGFEPFDNFWVFAGGLTDQEVDVTVTDVVTGEVVAIHNDLDSAFDPFRETGAFEASCAAAARRGTVDAVARSAAPRRPGEESTTRLPRASGPRNDATRSPRVSRLGDGAVQGAGCQPSATRLCLNDDRFAVTASWRTVDASGVGSTVELTDDTGYLTFFDPANVEVVVKVLDACDLPGFGNYWVFAGGLTDQEVRITVTDTATGAEVPFFNPLGAAFDPIRETDAFRGSCP